VKLTIDSSISDFFEKIYLHRDIENMAIGTGEFSFRVTVSVWGTTYEPGLVIDHQALLIEVADKAVYNSKSLGCNRFTFFPLQDFTRQQAAF
jgi:GGDEF domain-containing protein